MTYQYWRILSIDVWGDSEEGYYINQAFYTSNVLKISENATVHDILFGLPDTLTGGYNCENDYLEDCETLMTFYESSDSDTPSKPYLQIQLMNEYDPFDDDKHDVIGVIEEVKAQ